MGRHGILISHRRLYGDIHGMDMPDILFIMFKRNSAFRPFTVLLFLPKARIV